MTDQNNLPARRKMPMLGKGLAPLLGSSLTAEVAPRRGPATKDIVRVKRALHERLRTARIALGLSAETLADQLGIKAEDYAAFESDRWPPHYLINPLCRILKVCAGELYGTHEG